MINREKLAISSLGQNVESLLTIKVIIDFFIDLS